MPAFSKLLLAASLVASAAAGPIVFHHDVPAAPVAAAGAAAGAGSESEMAKLAEQVRHRFFESVCATFSDKNGPGSPHLRVAGLQFGRRGVAHRRGDDSWCMPLLQRTNACFVFSC